MLILFVLALVRHLTSWTTKCAYHVKPIELNMDLLLCSMCYHCHSFCSLLKIFITMSSCSTIQVSAV